MYVDESGDTGPINSPTKYFALSGLVIHESRWREFLEALIAFKKKMRNIYGLPIRTEIHSSEFIQSKVAGLDKYIRLAILRNFLDEIALINYISITNVIVNKSGRQSSDDIFEFAWKALFQRFENTLVAGNFPGGHITDKGFVITDATNGRKLTRLIRKMAVINYLPNLRQFGPGSYNAPIKGIIEDPFAKDSSETLPLQACDVAAYFLYQRFVPNSFIRKKNARNYFDRLRPVLNTRATQRNPLGIVEI